MHAEGELASVAPGSVVLVRDEEWLVASVEHASEGRLVRCRGLSELVRDSTATFYDCLDDIEVLDPRHARVVADPSPHFRTSRLWLEAMVRKTPVAYGDTRLTVTTDMLATSLPYQHAAVRQALNPEHIRPRILVADAVGLGKTLEIGMILAELIRRGRGERILVVTPKHVLEQFQHELWCRFALPLVRLDSAGIQQVRQVLPATRNPFTYFKRVIVSIDTLKLPRYQAHLARQRWDAVVIDESHNLTNTGTLNNELARVLAPTTDALILASATPHNGRHESFAELMRLLDPTSVSADGDYTKDDVARLVVRRHRHSPEVAEVVGGDWAQRSEPVLRQVVPSAAEDDVATELSQSWLYPPGGRSPYSGQTKALFPWTLAKAYLSSPAALDATITARRHGLDPEVADQVREIAALDELARLNATALNDTAGKLQALIERLREIGVGGRSMERAVVFAERVPTLTWLADRLPEALGLKPDQVVVLHGGLSEVDQQRIVDEFKVATSAVRVLVTGDIASEGVNLHAQCHHLIHYDIPWSLIRIQQRNGRIDRYGQRKEPVITSLVLTPSDERFSGDVRVLGRLMEREREAHAALGDAASLMGKHSEAQEEDAIRAVLAGSTNLDAVVRTVEEVAAGDDLDAWFADLDAAYDDLNAAPTDDDATRETLYDDDLAFLDEALRAAYHDVPHEPPSRGGVAWKHQPEHGFASLEPPEDLRQRLRYLPQDYLKSAQVLDRLQLATTTSSAEAALERARAGEGVSGSTWPEAHYLGPLHPVLDWAADRALASLGRNTVFAVQGDVEHPTVLVLGQLMNQRGGLVTRAWSTVVFPDPTSSLGLARPHTDLAGAVDAIGLSSALTNSCDLQVDSRVQGLIPAAVDEAGKALDLVLDASRDEVQRHLARWRSRADRWGQEAEQLELFGTRSTTVKRLARRVDEERQLARLLEPVQRLVRPMLVVLPTRDDREEA